MDDRLEYLDPVYGPLKRRLYLREARQLDLETGASHVRLLEMELDSLVRNPYVVCQFFGDAQLYGFREAWMYLSRDPHVEREDLPQIQAAVNVLLTACGAVNV